MTTHNNTRSSSIKNEESISNIKNEESITIEEHNCIKEFPIYPKNVIYKEVLIKLLKKSDDESDDQHDDGRK